MNCWISDQTPKTLKDGQCQMLHRKRCNGTAAPLIDSNSRKPWPGVVCEYREDHVVLLQSRVAWLEDFILNLQNASPSERAARLRTLNIASATPRQATTTSPASTQSSSTFYRTSNLHLTSDGSISFYGPTSIYHVFPHDEERPDRTDQQSTVRDTGFKNPGQVLEHFDIDLEADYPNHVYIYRDAFLRDHYGNRQEGKYWSTSLLLSICALGSLMLPENAAASIAIVSDLMHPSITAVQTFLCLAFCEIGIGNISKGWAFSGIAFRMVQDLGIQKDPEMWELDDQSFIPHEDAEIRRRIYWGCYISDKLISLIFGRPVQLLYNQGEVNELTTQPDPAFILPWRSVGFDDDALQQYTNISMIPYLKEQIKIARIVERMLSLISSASDRNTISQHPNLDSLNHSLLEWRTSLPEWADFKIWDAIDQSLKPSTAAVHLLYNATRIALNFNKAVTWDGVTQVDQAREACTLAVAEIHSIVRRFRKQHGLTHSPLVMVYALSQAIRASRAFGTSEETEHLMKSLSELAGLWRLADFIIARRLR
ncbi:fungal-specific transcription factor domain-containing protein [Paraphoma chrysanthemicola]|uniref:Fungal-specific transcription factor domain-containing protein n=1 Tax=Paraphoma chrysanthemicola TaxID=798071 RepID=A0A8K0QSX5_9PLEO|nr:fungal-specific transcription factor domain-containing protein [Paraphoma chrysanthemicola]